LKPSLKLRGAVKRQTIFLRNCIKLYCLVLFPTKGICSMRHDSHLFGGMCTDKDCGACQNDNNQSQHRASRFPVHGAPHCAFRSGIIGARPIEFLKWTKVQSCTQAVSFSKKARLAYFKTT